MAAKNSKPVGDNDGNIELETGSNGNEAISPADAFGDDVARDDDGNVKFTKDGRPARKRGRKSGSGSGSGSNRPNTGGTKPSNKTNSQTITAIETLAFSISGFHLALAAFTKSPEFNLDDSESDALAKSVYNVVQQFGYSPDPKIMAVSGLIATCAQIYGPRIFLVVNRRNAEKPINVKPTNITEAPLDINAYNFSGNN